MARVWLLGALAWAPLLLFQLICAGWVAADPVVVPMFGLWLLTSVIFLIHVWKHSTLDTLPRVGFTLAFLAFLPAMIALPVYWFQQVFRPARTRRMLDSIE